MAGKTGCQKIFEQFIADGITHMFGNPGTVEQGFLDTMREYPSIKYILSLQESIAVLMADGYARAAQKPALVQLHSSPGIGNGVGALYQAKRGHSPLIVIGGDAGIKYFNMDAQMANDLTAMMAPVTKYSVMVTSSKSLLRTLRRAVKIASTPPMGPVYVCLPMDILDEINDEPVFPSCIPSTKIVPENSLIEKAAKYLAGANKPMIYLGDGIAWSGASKEVAAVAELIGAEVYGADIGDFNMDTTHPLYQGATGHMFGSSSLPITRKGDVNLISGTYMLPEVFPELGDIFAQDAKVIHFDLNSYEIAKNHRVDIAAVCDPKLSLKMLAEKITQIITPEQKRSAAKRVEEIKSVKQKKVLIKTPANMAAFTEVLSRHISSDTIIFDEALTSSSVLTQNIPPKVPGTYFVTRGGSLGVGIPGALGIKLKYPDKTVIGFSGDGGSMYTIQALWTAARYNIGAKFVICNNGLYKLLELNIDQYWKERNIAPHMYPESFNVGNPIVRFDKLAESMGIKSIRVENIDQIAPAVIEMLKYDGPFLIDLIVK